MRVVGGEKEEEEEEKKKNTREGKREKSIGKINKEWPTDVRFLTKNK